MATSSQAYAYIALLCGACGIGKVYHGVHGVKQSASEASASSSGSGVGVGGDIVTTAPGTTLASRISPDAPGCGRGQVAPATQTPIDFMFVVDRSGSMNDTHEADAQMRATKWASLQSALTALFDDMGNNNGGAALALGIDYFNNDSDPSIEQPLQLMDRAWANTLISDISSRSAGGHTPTEDALRLSYTALASFNPGGPLANATKALVLVSDGKPNPEPADTTIIPGLVAAQLASTDKMRTFSIGIGELGDTDPRFGYNPAFMSDIAVQGGTKRNGCDPNNTTDPTKFCHYQITPSQSANITQDLVAAFNDIRKQVRSCTLPLGIEDAAHLEPRAIIVVAERGTDGQRVLPTDTWQFDDPLHPTSITLLGDECAYIKQDPTEHVFAIVGCACGTPGTSGAVGEGAGLPARAAETGDGTWSTNWCAYPFAPSGSGGASGCVGEGCTPP